MHFGAILLTGAKQNGDGAYVGAKGEKYAEENGNLIVTTNDGKSITIESWENGELSIQLDPIIQPGGPGRGGSIPDRLADPIILDLDGDGLELTQGRSTAVYFDIDGDGLRELTNWVMPDDGLLVFDANGNGMVDSALELFGYGTSNSVGISTVPTGSVNGFNAFELQSYTSGYEKLALFDTNADGIISAADGGGYTSLRVWRDINQDGRGEANELFSLTQTGVTLNFVQLRMSSLPSLR